MSVSPVERMKICLSVIENAEIDTEEGTEKQEKALEELQDWVEDIDIAAGSYSYYILYLKWSEGIFDRIFNVYVE